MAVPYNKNAATYDADAKAVTLRAVRGDTFAAALEVLSTHEQQDGSVLDQAVDIGDLAFDSQIYDGAGKDAGSFDITDDATVINRVELKLPAARTLLMRQGTYGFWVDAVNVTTGNRRTWIRGTLTITEKPFAS